MASNIPLHIIDEDGDGDFQDEFDWEAAVREIDKACDDRNFATSSSSHFAPPPTVSHTSKKNASKQSTLNRFIGKVGLRPPEYNRTAESYVGAEAEQVSSVHIDAEAAKAWIYPVNIPLRDYQFAITKTALFLNTLVALPTGLGKTLIAAVVIFNYFRWFPEGKIVFAAPSRPLVMQQIEACHNIVGISQEWTIDMTGQICPTKRAIFWKTKRVFFVTPQVLEKDIQSGTCLSKYIVCLVIDEAHRALGNYSYCVAVRELMSMPVQLRILALTATPGSKQPTIHQIINNICISTLEYRDEHDHDVSPYVHNRKIELIEVPLGQDALEVNNKLLEVIRPYVARLHANGLIQNRDYQTLSPIDLLNSRDKFRQVPPPDLPHIKYGEVEAYFAVLITLYHIRKLLSSHGIRPAYEMLEEKLRQGPFSRTLSKNEDIMNAKLLMQRSLSHGAPSPKLSKLLEVLINHFQTRDPQNSRVKTISIVLDIMNALESVRDLVKATEFIGQSSGKTLKGQSQKVQQAVLEKFRAGGYNVIVATSIGEEGLDIMEVGLVICFDANVSPLRMIQRMRRTGRKHDGRVVVLACQGSELKGYMRKQANSQSINKHMQKGGIHSFCFHPSPRMIPRIFKPEVQFVELSIDQFVPRGKKLKDDHAIETPRFREKLTVEETDLIVKYFHPTSESTWRPSLIAFPSFQAFPSKVCKVMHSYRTEMLIGSMQRLCIGV
ncbi:DEAD-box ATP-dependent RNA helicase FANCM-like [Hibiscus syriacus]|uniref:DEAD-box ATP-dependent RNA helicase FANCM-like n=1 Tax=Hibiscus syriacus TaxID=106335 RepID=UPI0019239098|nr:DEAD-box ATP-dependent RNA helicase FANCM-like [Hibiscus syriacus]